MVANLWKARGRDTCIQNATLNWHGFSSVVIEYGLVTPLAPRFWWCGWDSAQCQWKVIRLLLVMVLMRCECYLLLSLNRILVLLQSWLAAAQAQLAASVSDINSVPRGLQYAKWSSKLSCKRPSIGRVLWRESLHNCDPTIAVLPMASLLPADPVVDQEVRVLEPGAAEKWCTWTKAMGSGALLMHRWYLNISKFSLES